MALPVLTTVEDIDALTVYLKTKATGAAIREAKSVIDKKYLDGRKLKALEFWGFISINGERIALTDRGRAYARGLDEDRRMVLRRVLSEVNAYRTALEWAYHQKLDSVPAVDVAARWNEFNREEVESASETTLGLNAVCFFQLAQGAGLGALTIGRHGHPTRLDFDAESLRAFVESADTTPRLPLAEPRPSASLSGELAPAEVPIAVRPKEIRVFVSHGRNTRILEQVKKMLGFGGLDHLVAVEEQSAAIPVPEKIMDAMHRCNAGIIIVSADEEIRDAKGKTSFRINENVLIEIGAAFVLYKKKVILLVDKRVQLPSNLQGLYLCQYEGDALDWETGMKLQETLTKFREGLDNSA